VNFPVESRELASGRELSFAFPMPVYLDWNATTPPLDEALTAMLDAGRRAWGNPASVHGAGRAARSFVEDARCAVAELASADARDVVLTSGGTEANNLALRSALARGGRLITSRLEHPSVTRVAESVGERARWLALRDDGTVDLDDLERALGEGPACCVALQSVNHETGVMQPIAEAIAIVHTKAPGVWIHVDAIQAWGRVQDATLGATSRSLAAHKLRGPKGVGALVLSQRAKVVPVLLGGAQERGLRPGTVDPVACAGLAVAARHALEGPSRYAAVARLRDRLEGVLVAKGALRNGSGPRAPHVSNLAFPGWSGPELVAALDLEGVYVSSGSACSAGTLEPSPVLAALVGMERAASSVRVSLGDTTDVEVDRALEAFEVVLGRS